MKFIVQTIFIFLMSWLLQAFLPWWTMAIGAFAVGFVFANSGWRSFFAGLLGVGLLWFGMSLYIDISTQSQLAERVARLFPGKAVPLLYLFTALVGGLVGGLASLTGSILTYRKPYKW
jgi:hypothetical protein